MDAAFEFKRASQCNLQLSPLERLGAGDCEFLCPSKVCNKNDRNPSLFCFGVQTSNYILMHPAISCEVTNHTLGLQSSGKTDEKGLGRK